MQYALDETARRREKQIAHNREHGITPETVKKNISTAFDHVYVQKEGMEETYTLHDSAVQALLHDSARLRKHIDALKKRMHAAAANLEFEEAARLRDEIKALEEEALGI